MTKQWFFEHEGFEFLTLIALGSAPYGTAEIGEVLATVDEIGDGDMDSWFEGWMGTGERVRAIAESAEAAGHGESARCAYLRAASYIATAFFYVLGTSDPSRSLATWRRHRDCFDRATKLWPTPVEAVEIPYEDTALHGYFFSGGTGRRPLVILNNGSDGPVSDMIPMGAADAVARGYHALTFDGPGQGHALYEQELYFRYDWEAVVTPVVDAALARSDVDGDRVALFGVSQAGYWVPRAAAFDHRLAAVVADPGVVRVAASWLGHLPEAMVQLLADGEDEAFDEFMQAAAEGDSALQLTLAKRMEPYGLGSMAAVYHELDRWDLTDVAGDIACPILITDPDDEQFWPGQSRELYDLVDHPTKALVHFSAEEGANWHCEPAAPQLRAQRIFDWLDDVFEVDAAG